MTHTLICFADGRGRNLVPPPLTLFAPDDAHAMPCMLLGNEDYSRFPSFAPEKFTLLKHVFNPDSFRKSYVIIFASPRKNTCQNYIKSPSK